MFFFSHFGVLGNVFRAFSASIFEERRIFEEFVSATDGLRIIFGAATLQEVCDLRVISRYKGCFLRVQI